MNPIAVNALAKWPAVQDCYGWLVLDARGSWRLRNDYAQQHQLAGDKITHAGLIEFLDRHYQMDAAGRWYVQNGPQRVFVELAYTPWIVRLVPLEHGLQLVTTTGIPFAPTQCLQDEQGHILLAGEISCHGSTIATIALLHDQDLGLFAEQFDAAACGCGTGGHWRYAEQRFEVEPIDRNEVARYFHFIANPAASAHSR